MNKILVVDDDTYIRELVRTLISNEGFDVCEAADGRIALQKLGEEKLLSQVWINLIYNAIKFTPENGLIRVMLTSDKGNVVCTVADNGIGISLEDQIRIFERFYKVDKSRDRSLGGNGLGLSLVKKIIEIHAGRITVKSEKGQGAEFIVTLLAQSRMKKDSDI